MNGDSGDSELEEDLSALSDEELVARVRAFDPLDLLTSDYLVEIDRRGGPECLGSDPELQAEYQVLVDAMIEPIRRMMDNMGIGQQFKDLLAPEPPEFTFASGGFDIDPERWTEISEALEKSSPAALHSALVSTLEGGFGPIHDELRSHSDTLAEMRASLKELEENAPGKRAGVVLLWSAIIAAVTGVAAVAIAILK